MGRHFRNFFAWLGFLFFPGALVLETIELVQQRATTDAVISDVRLYSWRGSRPRSVIGRIDVTFSYRVGEENFQSQQKMAEFLHRFFSSNGRSPLFEKGQRVRVYYNPKAPQRAAMERGWFLWTWVLTALFAAYPAMHWASHRVAHPTSRFLLFTAGRATLYTAILAVFLFPEVILPRNLLRYAATWALLFAVPSAYEWIAHRHHWFANSTSQEETLP
jgi:hypothetical protein